MIKIQKTDRDILRDLILNTLYYYNCKEKVDAALSKIKGDDEDEKKEKDSKQDEKKKKMGGKKLDPEEEDADSIGSEPSVAHELTKQKTLQTIDDAAYTVHYVLSSLGRRDLSELFLGSKYNPAVETKRVRKNIFNLMYLYTKALESIKEADLRNHISYWLVMSALIERDMLNDID